MTATDPTLAALLAAIRDHPEEDTPRLEYADRLDELAGSVPCPKCHGSGEQSCRKCSGEGCSAHGVAANGPCTAGDPCPTCRGTGSVPDGLAARAEFIRVQCEVTGWEEPPVGFTGCVHCDRNGDYGDGPCRYHALRRRERELFRDSGPRWWNDLPGQWRSTGDDMRIETAEGIAYTVRRGFVESVTVPTLAVLFGGECDPCGGTGEGVSPYAVLSGVIPGGCPRCHGTGRTEGIAKALWAGQPVTHATVSDKQPALGRNGGDRDPQGHFWCREYRGIPLQSHHLPVDLFDLLTDGTRVEIIEAVVMTYPEPADALVAISRACVTLGRQWAEEARQAAGLV